MAFFYCKQYSKEEFCMLQIFQIIFCNIDYRNSNGFNINNNISVQTSIYIGV